MKVLGKWSVNNRVTVNLIMVFIIMAGLFAVLKMRREVYPQFALDMINVQVPYPGSTPEEVEEGICVKIEEKIKGIEGVKRILSTAFENMGSVTVEVETGENIQRVLDDIKAEVDRIDTFPEEAEEPLITEIINRDPTISVAVYGNASEQVLRKTAEKIRDDLVDTEPISLAELVGVRDYEISIEVSEENLRRFNLSFDRVVRVVRAGSIDLPGGVVKTGQGEILVRSKGQLYTGDDFKALPLFATPDGTVVRLGEVARVVDGFEDTDIVARFNRFPTAIVQVNRTSKEDIIAIAETVRDYVDQLKPQMPEGVQLAIWMDLSKLVDERIDLLLRNGVQGILLVFIALALFLNLRLAFWVSVGIPISFMGAFLVLDMYGATLNMISLFAFIMTLGILVDDAIIVGENIYTHYNRGKTPHAAVVDGLAEVGGPVVMAITTTVVAFLPLAFIVGIIGKFISIMPKAVIAILIVSLGEALIILPAHLVHALEKTVATRKENVRTWHSKLRQGVDSAMQGTIQHIYTPAIRYVVKNRYFTLSIGVGVLIVSIGIVIGGYVPFIFFPKGESDWIIAEMSYPLGTPYTVTQKAIMHIEDQAFALNGMDDPTEASGDQLVVNAFSLVGAIPRRDWKPPEFGGHVGQVWIELISSENRRTLSTQAIINQLRTKVGEIPGVESLTFTPLEGGPAGNPIEVQLSGHNFVHLKQAAEELKQELRSFPGTYDVTDNFKPGKREKRFKIKDGARSLGVTMRAIASQLRQAFYGEEALRIQRGRDDLKVMVRYSEEERRTLAGIEEMRIRTAQGDEIPIEEVAHITPGRAYSVIHRVDRKRVITVISNLDESTANASRIVADLEANFLPNLLNRFPEISFNLEGQERRTQESIESLQQGFLLAMMAIFLLLASQFRSYNQPIIIMLAIPFGLIGAITGHLIMGLPLTMISLFGIVALSGIVVNDSLILIDFINRAVRSGAPVAEAVIASGKIRFRPVLLTSVTTIAGLFPLLLERSFQAQFLIPMAVSISFGLLAATLLTLLYVPALYLVLDDINRGVHAWFGKPTTIHEKSDRPYPQD